MPPMTANMHFHIRFMRPCGDGRIGVTMPLELPCSERESDAGNSGGLEKRHGVMCLASHMLQMIGLADLVDVSGLRARHEP